MTNTRENHSNSSLRNQQILLPWITFHFILTWEQERNLSFQNTSIFFPLSTILFLPVLLALEFLITSDFSIIDIINIFNIWCFYSWTLLWLSRLTPGNHIYIYYIDVFIIANSSAAMTWFFKVFQSDRVLLFECPRCNELVRYGLRRRYIQIGSTH